MKTTEKHKALTKTDVNFFFKNGYLLVKNVYDPEDLKEARNFFISAFEREIWKESSYSSESILNDIYRIHPELVDIVINEKYVHALKAILGEQLVWLPECTVHYNRFTNWHNDTTEQEIKGVTSHKNPKEFLLQCATYFQSNAGMGGGLTVIPGTHVKKDRFLSLYKKDLYNRTINKVKKTLGISIFDKMDKDQAAIQVPLELGDLLVFDVRLYHKSPGDGTHSKGIQKFAIFNTFGNDNTFTNEYLQFMKTRPEPSYQFMQNIPIPDILYKKAGSLDIKIRN